jgi:hypothetical protein
MTTIPNKIGLGLLAIYWAAMAGITIYAITHRPCSSVLVERGFCKADVASSNLVEGFGNNLPC